MNCACDVNPTQRSMRVKSVVALGLLLAPVLGGVLYLRSGGECSACHEAAPDDARPRPEASWTGAAAFKLDGSGFAMEKLVGKLSVLYFWATWCPQCKVQRGVLKELAGEWGDRVRIVALSVDDDAQAVVRYLEDHARLSDELRTSSELLELFHVEALPTVVVVDAKGDVKSVSNGPMDAERLGSVVEPLLR